MRTTSSRRAASKAGPKRSEFEAWTDPLSVARNAAAPAREARERLGHPEKRGHPDLVRRTGQRVKIIEARKRLDAAEIGH